MKNMQLSAQESKATVNPAAGDGPRYPYGLNLHLSNESLAKLALAGLPAVGTELMLHAKVTVTEISEREEQDGDKQRSLSLQITDLALAAPPTSEEDAAKLYPKMRKG